VDTNLNFRRGIRPVFFPLYWTEGTDRTAAPSPLVSFLSLSFGFLLPNSNIILRDSATNDFKMAK